MKFKLEYVMEVDDFELLELVNDYQERSDEPTFNTLDDIPEALMIEALDEANYIEEEINDYMMVPPHGFPIINSLHIMNNSNWLYILLLSLS